MKKSENDSCLPQARVAVLERNTARLTGALCCEIDSDIEFSTEKLETYCLSAWEPLIFDSLLVAGAVEYCDRVLKRSALGWGRDFELVIAVHEPDRWNHPDVGTPLADSLGFLTGDRWRLDFVTRRKPVTPPRQGHFQMPSGTMAVIPFSDGLDLRAVAGIMARQLGDGLIRVRLGSKPFEQPATGPRQPFTSVPYQVKPGARRIRRDERAIARLQVCDVERSCGVPRGSWAYHRAGERPGRAGASTSAGGPRIRRFPQSPAIHQPDGDFPEGPLPPVGAV